MTRSTDIANFLSYAIIIAGSVLSLGASVTPMYTSGFYLSFGSLFLGIIPYVVYGCCLDLLKHRPWLRAVSGLVLAGIDVLARIQWGIFTAYPPRLQSAIVLCLALVIIVLTVALLFGRWGYASDSRKD